MKQLEKFVHQLWFAYLLFVVAWVFTFVIYFPAHKALLIDDGISGIWEIKQLGVKGFLNSYGFESFYHGHYSIIGILYLLFGTNTLGWFIVYTGMHALNTTLLFTACKKVYQAIHLGNASVWIALLGSILFLCSPYQSENIIWGATSHYFATFFILWFGLHFITDFATGSKTSISWIGFQVLFAFSLVTLEISFLFPLLFVLLYLLLVISKASRISLGTFFLKIILPQIAIVVIYLVCYKLKNGSWIPHDRAPLDTPVPVSYMITTLSQQLMKLFGFVHMFEFKTREMVYAFAVHWKKIALFWSLLFGILTVWQWYKDRTKGMVFLFLLIAGLSMYLPFVRVYFMYIVRIENDRYAYFASAFLLQALVLVLFSMHRWVRGILYVAYLAAFIYFIFPTVKARSYSAKLYTNYLNKLPDTIQGKTYLLNVPSYCADVYMFRAAERLPISYQAIFGKDIFSKVKQVAWYNAQTDKDTFAINKLSDVKYEMLLKTNGSWWMNESIGASNYENDQYSFVVGEWGNYTITFKQPLGVNDAVLYYNGKRFVKVN